MQASAQTPQITEAAALYKILHHLKSFISTNKKLLHVIVKIISCLGLRQLRQTAGLSYGPLLFY